MTGPQTSYGEELAKAVSTWLGAAHDSRTIGSMPITGGTYDPALSDQQTGTYNLSYKHRRRANEILDRLLGPNDLEPSARLKYEGFQRLANEMRNRYPKGD
jgi:hypothetical protein